MPDGTHVVSIRRLLQRGDEPLFYHRESLIYDPRRPTVEAELGVTALRDMFEGGLGPAPSAAGSSLHASVLTDEEAAHLAPAGGSAAWVLEHVFYGYDDTADQLGLVRLQRCAALRSTRAWARPSPEARRREEDHREYGFDGLDPASLAARIAALDEQGALDAVNGAHRGR